MTSDTVYIDADFYLFRSAVVCEEEYEWDEDTVTLITSVDDILSIFKNEVELILEKTGRSRPFLCFTAPTNFRKGINSEYKAHRGKTRKPLGLNTAQRRLSEIGFDVLCWANIEADDVISIHCADTDAMVASVDKDFLTVPCYLFDGDSVQLVDRDQAKFFFLMQVLTGDAVDNYKGCPGIGPKKAAQALERDCSWNSVVSLYEKAGLTEGHAIENAQMAHLVRKPDYNKKTCRVTPWSPKMLEKYYG